MKERATRHGLMVVVGRIGFVGLWFGAVLLVYRGLGQDEAGLVQAGLFAITIAIVKLASGCIVDPGDVALMSRAPGLLRAEPEAAYRLFRSAFLLRLGATVFVSCMLLCLAGVVDQIASRGQSIAPLMGWVVAAIMADMLFRSVMVVLQTQERFRALVLLEGALQIARLAAILILWGNGWITVKAVLAVYIGAALLMAAVGAARLMPRGLFTDFGIRRADLIELLGALKWLVPGMLLGVISDRLDLFLVYTFGGADDAGRYGAMVTLALVPDLIAGSLAAILQPRITRMRNDGSYHTNQRNFLRISIPGVVLSYAMAVAVASPAIGIVLGTSYTAGVPILLWLLAGTLCWLAVTPLPLAMVAVHAPQRLALVALLQSGLIVFAGLPLFWLFGEVGMAQGVCIMRTGVAFTLVAMARRLSPRPVAALSGEGTCASLVR